VAQASESFWVGFTARKASVEKASLLFSVATLL
jgi:hypothetical protein